MNKGSTSIKSVKGGVVVSSVDGQGNIIANEVKIEKLVIQQIASVPTEVQPGEAAGLQGSKIIQNIGTLKEGIDEILAKTPGKSGQVQAGDLSMSRVDLLLKKAMLLGSEANQKLFDYLKKNQAKIQQKIATKAQSTQGISDFRAIQNEMYADFDMAAHMDKLKEIYEILKEANELDPTNTEVLLHMAQLLIYLTPDDPSDEQEILFRIRTLLSYPKNETERFHMAQATYLLALSKEDDELLLDARAMFENLGQREWVRAIDQLVALFSNLQKPNQQGSYGTPQVSPQAGFQPIGRWQIQISEGSVMFLDLNPDATFQATQQRFGMSIQAAGQWAFNPYNQMLQMQGLVNGFQPFMLGIMIQGQQSNGYYGVGTDSYNYFLTRT